MIRPFLLLWLLVPNHLVGQDDVPPVRTFTPYSPPAVQRVDTPTDPLGPTTVLAGRVDLVMDPRIERLMGDYAERKHALRGYRVQVFLGDRRTAEETKRAILLKDPDLPVYLSWLAPNFRLRVGDLRTRVEAEHLLRQLKAEHPGSYIVSDEIEPPVLPGE